jgi:hypothetical protein
MNNLCGTEGVRSYPVADAVIFGKFSLLHDFENGESNGNLGRKLVKECFEKS